jgi:hypothetical protein
VLKGTFEWSHVPASVEDFVEGWCEVNNSGDRNKFLLFGFGVVCWALWKARNKMAIEKKVVKSPRVLIFQVISLMQQWRILLLEPEQKLVQGAAKALKLKMRQSI